MKSVLFKTVRRIAMLALACGMIYLAAVNLPLFNVRGVNVSAADPDFAARIDLPPSVWSDVNFFSGVQQLAERICDIPGVGRVAIRRNWDLTLEVRVEPDRPLLLVNRPGMPVITEGGKVIAAPADLSSYDLPLVSCKVARPSIGERISDWELLYVYRFYREVLAVSPRLARMISQIRFSPEEGIVTYLSGYRSRICLGIGNYPAKLRRLETLLGSSPFIKLAPSTIEFWGDDVVVAGN